MPSWTSFCHKKYILFMCISACMRKQFATRLSWHSDQTSHLIVLGWYLCFFGLFSSTIIIMNKFEFEFEFESIYKLHTRIYRSVVMTHETKLCLPCLKKLKHSNNIVFILWINQFLIRKDKIINNGSIYSWNIHDSSRAINSLNKIDIGTECIHSDIKFFSGG